ncbi:MAG: anthranilate phosphoribosyltransferase [Actinobacteria bacterium 21-64-8]|nr:MAG: anthranilate phosphoribosyltransferase [Actinobacteria bacterium 21-64-8]
MPLDEPPLSVETFASQVLNPLVRGTDLERDEAREVLALMLTGAVADTHIASFLTALTAKGETAAEMTGFIDAMIDAASTFSIGDDVIDVVGTGGDQLHTVNISTMASLVVAGCGVRVAKHGNRAASSSVGSADVLEALGVRLDVNAATVRACVDEAGIGFCYAPAFNPALGYLGPIRRTLGFRTIFNVLGPLANPALVRRTLIGVAQSHLLDAMAQVLMTRGTDYAILVHGEDGLDELSLGAPSQLEIITPAGRTTEFVDAGKELALFHDAASIRGGDVSENVRVVRAVLSGSSGPVFNVVCANAALALRVAGRATTLAEGFTLAQASITEGRAQLALERLVEVSNA